MQKLLLGIMIFIGIIIMGASISTWGAEGIILGPCIILIGLVVLRMIYH